MLFLRRLLSDGLLHSLPDNDEFDLDIRNDKHQICTSMHECMQIGEEDLLMANFG